MNFNFNHVYTICICVMFICGTVNCDDSSFTDEYNEDKYKDYDNNVTYIDKYFMNDSVIEIPYFYTGESFTLRYQIPFSIIFHDYKDVFDYFKAMNAHIYFTDSNIVSLGNVSKNEKYNIGDVKRCMSGLDLDDNNVITYKECQLAVFFTMYPYKYNSFYCEKLFSKTYNVNGDMKLEAEELYTKKNGCAAIINMLLDELTDSRQQEYTGSYGINNYFTHDKLLFEV